MHKIMNKLCYTTGEEVVIGDIVNIGSGNVMQVVVVISQEIALAGFNAHDWSYLINGVILQDQKTGLLFHIDKIDEELALIKRAKRDSGTSPMKTGNDLE